MSATHTWTAVIGTPACTNPSGAEGVYACDVTTRGHRYQCIDGIWVDLGVDQANCPITGGIPWVPIAVAGSIIAAVAVFLLTKKNLSKKNQPVPTRAR